LQLSAVWRDESRDETLVVRHSNGRDWLREELDKLIEMVSASTSQIEIAAAFPDRTWDQIRRRYDSEMDSERLKIKPKPIKDAETYGMYLARLDALKPTIAGDGDHWSDKDVRFLLELVDAGATAVQLASAFPARCWVLLRLKITRLLGKGSKSLVLAKSNATRLSLTISHGQVKPRRNTTSLSVV